MSSTGGMGRGSDTRIYAPRSESSHMFSANEGEEKYNPVDPNYKEWEKEKKLNEDDEKEALRNKLRHIKVLGHHGKAGTGEPESPDEADTVLDPRKDLENELSRQTGPPGNRGHELDMATGAKTGTGSSMGHQFMASEPMDNAWSSLLKEERPYQHIPTSTLDNIFDRYGDIGHQFGTDDEPHMNDYDKKFLLHYLGNDVSQHDRTLNEMEMEYEGRMKGAFDHVESPQVSSPVSPYHFSPKSELMDNAWSELLKRETAKTMEGRRKKEQRAEFRPSTGQFKKPPGGQSGGPGSTMRRFKARMRGIKSGKKTGLMKPHLAVEMSHRGIKTKQPMSKDPARYRAYMGQQEDKKILGGARTVWSPHARYAERSTRAGPTGGGQLTGMAPGQAGQMRKPSLRSMGMPRMRKPRAPRMPPSMGQTGMPPMGAMSAVPPLPQAPPMPPDPSQMMMSEDKISQSDLMKMNYSDMAELRTLLRRIARAKEQEAKESKKKAGTNSATEGPMPSHPAGVSGENDDMDPDGPTENDEMKANRLGLDPAGYLTSKRGHMG